MKKPTSLVLLCVFEVALLCGLMLMPTLAYQTDAQQIETTTQAGTVVVSAPVLTWLPADPALDEPQISGSQLTAWAPGDINALRWKIDNLGSKSIDLRYTLRLYWNEGPGMTQLDDESAGSPLWAEDPYIYLYPATMSDADIHADLNSAKPSRFIALGTADVQYTNAAGALRFGYSYRFTGATLDGAGQAAETGDATTPGATSDSGEFKIAFAPGAPAGFMNRKLAVALYVEGKQHRNTTDSDWRLAGIQEIQ
ncbi:MAG: hypothetical protein FWC54_03650 [Actinomycetia bacterium]|nr:hypothetical protein [Actinomycetes bacterium]